MTARALELQALFSRASSLFFTWLPYLEHQNALSWVLKWAHHLPPHWALIHAALYQMGGDLAFHQGIDSPNPLQLGSRGWGLFHGPILSTSTWYHDDLGHHRYSRCPKIQIQGHIYTSLLKITFLILVASFVSSSFLSQAKTFFFFCSRAQWNMCFSF